LAANPDAKVLAGGQSLIPMMALRLATPVELVDLRCVDHLQQIDVNGRFARVGSMVRQATAEHHEELGRAIPLLPLALASVGHFQIRNRGTVGGSLAHADPAAELPAVALTLDATMEIVGPGGRREVSAADFFESAFSTAIGEDEILAAMRFPIWESRSGFAVEEVARRHGDFALVGAVCGIQLDERGISRAAITPMNMGSTPLRAPAAAERLVGADPAGVDVAEIGVIAVADTNPPADLHASSDYRRQVAAHVVGRAIGRAIEEAQRG
jgi:carbon-monoxide dehydrogenase medium subunit